MRALVFAAVFGFVSLVGLRARAQGCVIAGEPATLVVNVTPSGGPAFAIVLDHLDVTVSPTRDPALANVRVTEGLAFAGTTNYVPYVVRAPATLFRGVVRITRATLPFDVRGISGRLVANLELAHGIIVHDVPLECRALALGAPPHPVPVRGPVRNPRFMPREATFTLFAAPGDTSGLRVSTNNLLTFDRVVIRDEWANVRWRDGTGGASLQGFLRADALVQAVPQVSVPSIGDPGPPEGAVTPVHVGDPSVYVGPATLDAGTEVTRGTTPFATTIAGVTYYVRVRSGEPRAELLRVPGMHERGCPAGLCDTFVPASAVRVPARR